jgi:hypothetical protein
MPGQLRVQHRDKIIPGVWCQKRAFVARRGTHALGSPGMFYVPEPLQELIEMLVLFWWIWYG